MPSPNEDLLTAPQQGTLGFGQPAAAADPLPAPELAQQADLEQRRAKTSTGDYAGSMLRQTWFENNAMGALVGAGMDVDPNYNVFADPQLKELSKTVQPEELQYLYRATSPANLLYTHGRLMEKQQDLARLAQMGGMGQAGNMAFGFLDPVWLLAGGVAGKAAQLTRVATASRAAVTGNALADATARAGQVVAEARRGSSLVAGVTGVTTGGLENAAIEWGRQQVSMDDDTKGIIAAGLMGAAMSSPFVALGMRRAGRIHDAANQELDTLQALQHAADGHELTPEQTALIQDTHARIQDVKKLEDPGLSEEQYLEFLQAYHERWDDHVADVRQFSDALDADTRSKAQNIIDEFYSTPASEHEAQLAELKRQNTLKDIELQRQGRAVQRQQNLAAAAEAHRAGEEAAITGPHGPSLVHLADSGTVPDTALGSALKRALKARDESLAAHQAAEDARAVKAGLLTAEEAGAQSKARASKKAAWDAADAADEARKQRDFEAMIRDRELTRMVAEEPVHGETPAEAPSEPVAVPEQAPQGDTSVVAPEAPVAPQGDIVQKSPTADSFVGKVVTWLDAKSGEMMEGKVQRVSPTGKLVIENEMGELKAVAHTDVFGEDVPAGFLPGSVGAAQIGHIVRTPDPVGQNSSRFTGWQSIPGTNGKLKFPPRLDLYAHLNESKIPGVRALANILIKDPVGKADGSVQSFTASEWRHHFKSVIGGEFHRTADDAYRTAVKASGLPFWKHSQFRHDFYEAASQVLRGDHTVLQSFDPAVQAEIHKVSAALRKGLDRFLEEAKKSGVEGAAGVPPNAAYVNRIWRQDKIRAAMDLHGRDAVYQLVANSLTGMGAHGPLTGDVAKAKSFLGVVMKLEYSPALQNINLGARDMGALRDELRATGKLTDSDIDTLVDVMFEQHSNDHADAGQATPLKFRFDLDETTGMQTPAGMLRVSDLLENDARVLLDRYGSTMGGHAAMAKVGIRSQADFAKLIKSIEDEIAADHTLGGTRAAGELKWLQDIQANILGRPMSTADFSGTARFAAAFRGYARSTMLGQLGLSAAFEMKQAIGIMGVRAFLQQMPSFAGFISALRRGYLPEQGLARDVMMIGGWGQEKAAAYARAREIDEGFAADFMKGYEHKANAVSHAVDIISGNASFTSLTKQISAMMSAQRLHDFASGLKTMKKGDAARLAGQGLEGQLLQDTMRDLRAYADVSGDRITSIRHEEWLRDEPDTYEAFQGYMARQVRDAIQDHDLGETLPFMHSTLGKMFGELKTFFFVAHAKNLLKNVHYADGTTAQVYLMSFLGESLAYAIQQAMNNPGELDKRLSPEVMGPAIWARMATMGFTQMVADTGFQAVTGKSMLMQGSTSSGTNNRNLFDTPSRQLLGKVFLAPGEVMRGLGVGTRPLLQSEAKDLWSTLPGSNTYGLRGMGAWLAEGFPKSAPAAP